MPGFSDQNLFLAATFKRSRTRTRTRTILGEASRFALPRAKASLKKTDNLSLSPGNVPLTESEPPAECSVQLCRE
jgi:hypothetical protein